MMRSLDDEQRARCLWCKCRDGSEDAEANECGCDCHDPDSASYRDEDNIRATLVPVNRILTVFRVYVDTSDINSRDYAVDWLSRDLLATHRMLSSRPVEEAEHARRVLTRLAALS